MEKKYKVIFHVDLNAFFASCEMAQNPALKKIPLGIGGRKDRGVLTTANYEARKYGVSSAMPVGEARRLCPNLEVLPVNFPLYEQYSNLFFDLLSEYTDTIEKASIDEGYLDMSTPKIDQHPLALAKEIQDRLLKQYDLPVSIGIAPNMFLAKMASDMKKPLGITVLRKRDLDKKLWPLPIEKMHGIGKKTYPDLKLIGINTIGDLATYQDDHKLSLVLGNRMQEMQDKANGIDERVVDPLRYEDYKSIGNSETYALDLQTEEEVFDKLTPLTRKVVNRLVDDHSVAKTISIQVRYHDFSQITRSFTLEQHTDNFYDIFQVVERLYEENTSTKPIRLLGVSVTNLKAVSDHYEQLNLFKVKEIDSPNEKINVMLQEINKVYGKDLIHKGTKKNDSSK
ncbi:MAG: DNA polymerase IV [Candidatus Izemoplasmataceae bacterium]